MSFKRFPTARRTCRHNRLGKSKHRKLKHKYRLKTNETFVVVVVAAAAAAAAVVVIVVHVQHMQAKIAQEQTMQLEAQRQAQDK